jgi:hypothetical protein
MADTLTAAPYVRLIIKTDREPNFAAASNFFLSMLTAALRGEMLAITYVPYGLVFKENA